MKLSLCITTDDEDSPDYPDNQEQENIEKILTQELMKIYPASENYQEAEISLTFMNADNIRALNQEYRNINEPTDVLSFPLIDDDIDKEFFMPVLSLGDIVICKEYTQKLHPELNLKQAVNLMIAHSFLHLLGYDHDTEENEKIMWELQESIAEKINGVNE